MKTKNFIIYMIFFISFFSNAQILKDLAKTVGTTVVQDASTIALNYFNVSSLSNQVMGLLSPQLKLTSAQIPVVNALVTELLNKKKSYLPTALTDKASYAANMSELRVLFPSKMKGILTAVQYASLLGVLPKSSTSTSALVRMMY